MADVIITRYKHGFKVETFRSGLQSFLKGFNQNLTQSKPQKERGRVFSAEGDKFYAQDHHNDAYYYNNHLYDSLMQNLDNFQLNSGPFGRLTIETFEVVPEDGVRVNFDQHTLTLVEPEESRFYDQNAVVEQTSNPAHGHYVLEIQTGRGKTAMAMKTIVRQATRTLIVTKSAFLEKWKGDLTAKDNSLSLKPGELLVVSGMAKMDNLLAMGLDGELSKGRGRKEVKVILMSNNTLDLWIQEAFKQGGAVAPTDICKVLGIGLMVYDESHMLFRMNYWSQMILNPPRLLDLSATLRPGSDHFIARRYAERFPSPNRISLDHDCYIDAFSIYYHSQDRKFLDRMKRLSMYNHPELEKYVLSKRKMREAYFKMVFDILDAWYLRNRVKGQRALVFFSMKQACTLFVEYLQERCPDLNIQRNIQGDDYDTFVQADIGVSTPGKSGTAVDIKGLVLSICTVAIEKENTNLQILGRTRKPADGTSPRVVFLHCEGIAKHRYYLKRRKEMFEGMVKSFRVLNSQFVI